MSAFHDDNREFENWLRTECAVVEKDLDYKHKRMKKNAFVFLRATFFRWATCIETVCPELKDTPEVLSVGDTHVENFGTWRDGEGRLIWGVNDFDEAAVIAYPFDLVRLAASVRLSPGLAMGHHEAANAILDGYRNGIEKPRPALLDEDEAWMRPYVACSDDERQKFWTEVDGYPTATPPSAVAQDLANAFPPDTTVLRFASRVKGGGSLGRPRYVAVGTWRGGKLVREAKALVPSAWEWAHGRETETPRFLELATGKYRAFDPFLTVKDRFIIRRIAVDARKVDLGDDGGAGSNGKLLHAMGFDLAAIHAATGDATSRIREDLKRLGTEWLHDAAKTASESVEKDFSEWRQ